MTPNFVLKLYVYFCLAAQTHQDNNCCPKKQVDGKIYSYVGTAEESEKKVFGCFDNCVYSLDGSTEKFCFAQGQGGSEAECLAGKAYTGDSFVSQSIKGCFIISLFPPSLCYFPGGV